MSHSRTLQIHAILRWLTRASFAAFLVLALATHSAHWRVGPFTWLPVLRLPALLPARATRWGDEQPMVLGILTLIPLLLALSWPLLRLVELRLPEQRRRWRWGWRHITLPLLGLTLLGFLSIGWSWLAAGTRLPPLGVSDTAFQLLSLGLVWATYLFVVNERPALTWPLAAVVVIQSLVGLAQFVRQSDLGLTMLGELDLDPAISGVSVLMAGSQRWLRAYGLTGHPNLLAALLAPLILYLMSAAQRAGGWRRWLLLAVVGIGAAALVASASRAAWLAFAAASALWLAADLAERRQQAAHGPGAARPRARRIGWLAALVVIAGLAALFLAVYGSLFASRFINLESSIEARSLFERQRDWGIAVELILRHPWAGVGMGSYLAEARAIDPAARMVHNVPLLVTAELGVLAGLLWLWLTIAPFAAAVRLGRGRWSRLASSLAPWLAVVVMGLFHGLPWINTGWRAAILMALILAVLANEIAPEKPSAPDLHRQPATPPGE